MQPTSMSLPENVDAFVKVFLGALGGTSTKQVVLTVTPAPSSTSSTGYEVSSLTDTLASVFLFSHIPRVGGLLPSLNFRADTLRRSTR